MTQPQGAETITALCLAAGVSRASYYRFLEVQPKLTERTALQDSIQRAALKNRFYGYRRITVELRKQGCLASRNRVRKLMKMDNLLAVRRRKFIHTTNSSHRFEVHPNLAARTVLSGLNQLWVADITYIRLAHEFVYLALVLDAYSRRVVGWALGRSLQASLPLEALNHALCSRRPLPGLIHHSDRGSQYACDEYITRLQDNGIFISMSRAGRPTDNARCESLIKTLKQEEIACPQWNDIQQLETHIKTFIEDYYNETRLHSALRYCSPNEFERSLVGSSMPATLSFSRHRENSSDVQQLGPAGEL